MQDFNLDEDLITLRIEFRRLSRQVLRSVIIPEDHVKRILFAAQFTNSTDAVQGAIADYFYSCWYEITSDDSSALKVINEVKHTLHPQVTDSFLKCINKTSYVQRISTLATRWSVIVSPSMNVARHHLRTSKEHTNLIIETTISKLLAAKVSKKIEDVQSIESEFFDHCLVCEDLMAFMKVWFKLSKKHWEFDNRWVGCRKKLEKINEHVR